MKQLLQNLNDGQTRLVDVPAPRLGANQVLIRNQASLVSVGTERMLVQFGKANLLQKARQQPDKVRQVLAKLRTDGVMPTLQAVQAKLGLPIPLGYSSTGTVVAVGASVQGLRPGDRVVSNGSHAQIVAVPENLCARIPSGPREIGDHEACFTVIASIGLQGVRLAAPTLGEVFVVTGLGLIGLLTAQILRAHGCRVIGIDFDDKKLALARTFGVETVALSQGEDPVARAHAITGGRGVDGVLITASTKSSEPVHQAAMMCRKRGRIVLVGVTGLELQRADFYEKELSFQVSCSYGPGRYDPRYEQAGQDYPIGFVRWTEQRNFEAVLDLLADGRLDVNSLITHRFPFERAQEAYALLGQDANVMGVVLEYPSREREPDELLMTRTVPLAPDLPRPALENPARVGLIGAGNYTNQVFLPALKATGASLVTIASAGGTSGASVGVKFGFARATTDTNALLADPAIDLVVVTTRHDTHADFVCKALEAGKHVFVEKPLAIDAAGLDRIIACRSRLERPPLVGVGFNRRFAPQVQTMRKLLAGHAATPKCLVMTVNAGAIPFDNWNHDPTIGGGRIIGEGCHFIDLMRYLVGHPIERISAMVIGGAGAQVERADKMTLTLAFKDGSLGTVHYFANGHKSYPKERLEVFCDGRILVLDNFRALHGYGFAGFNKQKLWQQDKGHAACIDAFVQAVRSGQSAPIPFEELVEVTRASFDAVSIASGSSRD